MIKIPRNATEEDIELAYSKGMLRKEELSLGAEYEGFCRNASKAIWNGESFTYLRTKWGHSYYEDIKYPTDEQFYDVFIPIRRIE